MRFSKAYCLLVFLAILGLVPGALAQTNPLPEISAIDATNYLNQQVIVTDKVVGVALRPTIWLLHLNQKFPNSPLNCVVRGDYTNAFPNFEDYLGQRIRVTGRITDFRGRLELVLTSTNQIEVTGLAVMSTTEARKHTNQQVIVTAKVEEVMYRARLWYLMLDRKYPKSPLPCVVFGEYTNNFPNFQDYQDQNIAVTGWTTNFGGRVEIVLTSTNQIQIIHSAEMAATIPAPPSKPVAIAPVTVPVQVTPPVAQPAIKAGDTSSSALAWILGLLAVISVLLAAGVFLIWRRTSTNARAIGPANAVLRLPDAAQPDSLSVLEWKQRALVAEAMAGQQGQMLREKIMPELTEFAKQSLVQGLYAQRNALLETHQEAQLALAEMESRLVKIQAPLHERIRAYEQRIVELEKEVDTQGDEVRELTRATLGLVRKKLEDERERERLQSRFN
jgi:hypothetical protein